MELPRPVDILLTEKSEAWDISFKDLGNTEITELFKTPWVNPWNIAQVPNVIIRVGSRSHAASMPLIDPQNIPITAASKNPRKAGPA